MVYGMIKSAAVRAELIGTILYADFMLTQE